VRDGRPFHPQGLCCEATWRVERASSLAPAAAVLRPGAEAPAIVRLSRGLGLPDALPDVYGIAVRLPDAGGPGRHQDLLFNTSIDAPLLHHLLLPAPGWWSASYTTSLPYRAGGPPFLCGLLPPDERSPGVGLRGLRERLRRPGTRLGIAVAPLEGRWRRVGTLTLGAVREDLDVAFNPWHDAGGLRPAGALQRWRRAAYRESQEERAA
jgi:hypothetical protein